MHFSTETQWIGKASPCDKHELCRDAGKANKSFFCQESVISQETAKLKAFLISILIQQHWLKNEKQNHINYY